MPKEKKKYKKLSEEDDITIWEKYNRSISSVPGYREMTFFVFMIVLYYSQYARWLFWALLILFIIGALLYIVDEVKTYQMVLKKELIKRGYNS